MLRLVVNKFYKTLLLRNTLQLKYSTETKNVFSLPKKQFINPSVLGEVTAAIDEAYTVKMLAYLFRAKQDNIKFFTDLQVAAMYEHILNDKLEIDDTMYSVIIPITIEYNGQALGQIAYCSAKLNLQHPGLWEVLLKKLDQANIYRYLTLNQIVLLLNAFVGQGTYINHPLIVKLSNVVAQQKSYYNNFPFLLNLINQTNQILAQKGQKTLKISEAYQQIA